MKFTRLRCALSSGGAAWLALALPVSAYAVQADEEVFNAPVTPDAIYLARTGGLSVLDLNGFGQSTGSPSFDPECPIAEGNSNFPNNPNVALQGAFLIPPLAPGTSTRDGGSAGPLTLTQTSALTDLALRPPSIASAGDMMLGHALDTVFSNGPAPFGCSSGGGSLCSASALKELAVEVSESGTLVPWTGQGPPTFVTVGRANPVSFAPHPNPPPLLDTMLCTANGIAGQEPTAKQTHAFGFFNQLVPSPGFLGDPATCTPPSGLLASDQNSFFVGPSLPAAAPQACESFSYRQALGHFMYVTDPARDELVVMNSNRFTVLDRVAIPSPREMAMSPNLGFLAVGSGDGSVYFVDIQPSSPSFHEVVKVTEMPSVPAGIAWQPDNQDILVCLEQQGALALVSAFSFDVRKVIGGLERPFEVAPTHRQAGFGFDRDVYFAFVLGRDGRVSVYESGPDGANGWGFDDVLGVLPARFPRPTAIVVDPTQLGGGVWIAHRAKGGGGAISNLVLRDAAQGRQWIEPRELPNFRDLSFQVVQQIGSDQLTGVPVDLAFDDLRNLAALPDPQSPWSATTPALTNGKSHIKVLGGQEVVPASRPTYLFAAVPNSSEGPGVVDVIEISSSRRIDTNVFEDGVQSIAAEGIRMVMGYYRQ